MNDFATLGGQRICPLFLVSTDIQDLQPLVWFLTNEQHSIPNWHSLGEAVMSLHRGQPPWLPMHKFLHLKKI